ncbi:MAG: hypothetical protein L0322_11575, partial [Chloroflexi bacterium]|nr:hypothetical protein [Chloroflexota bacterium]
VNEYCLHLSRPLAQLPPWDEKLGQKVARDRAVVLAGRLEMGRFHQLLPAGVAVPAVVRQLNMERLRQVYQSATIVHLSELYPRLDMLAHS